MNKSRSYDWLDFLFAGLLIGFFIGGYLIPQFFNELYISQETADKLKQKLSKIKEALG